MLLGDIGKIIQAEGFSSDQNILNREKLGKFRIQLELNGQTGEKNVLTFAKENGIILAYLISLNLHSVEFELNIIHIHNLIRMQSERILIMDSLFRGEIL